VTTDGVAPRNLGGTELKRLHREWRRRQAGRLTLVLDAVGNPYNLGSILRSAAAYGVDQLWLVSTGITPTHPKVAKTALGSQRFCTWTQLDSITDALDAARAAGTVIVGLELADAAEPLFDLDLSGDVCLVVGHEDRGLSKVALSGCDRLGYLPLVGKIGSLNVAQATTAGLAEVRRQQWGSASS
jgi:tRNA (guanosine-2'-O-)-methyltransferase